jgi:glycine cleavage system H protein
MTLKYTKDHEWIKVDGDVATIGITSHAAEALGELVYVELPEVDSEFKKGDSIVVVESSKSASDVYTPVSGKIASVNGSLEATPENVNNSTYEDGWLVKIQVANQSDLDGYMTEDEYKEYLSSNA